jgi:hypothetical protein
MYMSNLFTISTIAMLSIVGLSSSSIAAPKRIDFAGSTLAAVVPVPIVNSEKVSTNKIKNPLQPLQPATKLVKSTAPRARNYIRARF